MIKVIIKSVLIFFMVFIFFAGCKKETPDAAAQVTLTLWDDKSNDDEARVIKAIIEQWNTENPHVIIKREAVDIESYKMKLKTAVAAGEAPDIFYSYGAGFSRPFVNAGKLLALDDYLSDAIKEKALPGTWTYGTYDGTTYGLPINMWCGVLYCNTELFDKYQVNLPETFDELLSAVKTFRKNGIGAIGVGGNERWTAMFYHNILALKTAGAALCNQALEGKASFDAPEFVKAVDKLEDLVEVKAFNDGHLGLNYDEVIALFKQGQIPMIYQGTWLAGELEEESSPVKGKIAVKNFPVIPDGKGVETEFLGGAIDLYMINGETSYKKEAVRALEYICENYSTKGFAEGMGLPVFKNDFSNTVTDRLTSDIVTMVNDATGFVLAWDTFLEGKDAQLHLDLVQEVFAGIRTPEDFVKEMTAMSK